VIRLRRISNFSFRSRSKRSEVRLRWLRPGESARPAPIAVLIPGSKQDLRRPGSPQSQPHGGGG